MSESCKWYQVGDYDSTTWATQCKEYFTVNDGTPFDNDFAFCCFCGGHLVQVLQEIDE